MWPGLRFLFGGAFMEFLLAVLTLFDRTLSAMAGVSLFSVFLSGFLMLTALGAFLMLRDLAAGKRSRR